MTLFKDKKIEGYKFIARGNSSYELYWDCMECDLVGTGKCVMADCRGGYFKRFDLEYTPQTGKEVFKPLFEEGCGNHGCRVNPPKGQGTNGRCRCDPPGKSLETIMQEKRDKAAIYARRDYE